MLLIAIAGRAEAESRPGYGGAVVGTVLGEPATFDPIAARSPADTAVVGLLFDTLYRIGPDGRIGLGVAAAFPEVSGGKSRIAIRPGVHFHNGATLSAADVAASLVRVKASDGAGWLLAAVDDITIDGDTVVLGTARKDLAQLLTAPATSITPRGAAPRPTGPIGSGPFRFAALKRDRLELERYAEHFAGPPYLDRVTLRWFVTADGEARLYETGGADWSLRGATAFAGGAPKHPTEQLDGPATVLVYLGFGTSHLPITANRDFRMAIDAALARGGLDVVGVGERVVPTYDVVPVDLGGPELPDGADRARLAAAQAALARAAVATPELAPTQIHKVSLELLVDSSRPDDREIAERVVVALDTLGVAATIAPVTAPELAQRVAHGPCDLYIGHLAVAVASPAMMFAAAYAVGGDRDTARRLGGTAGFDASRTRTGFHKRLPIVPLLARGVRVHARRDLRGLWFDGAARLGIADLFVWGRR